MYQVRTCYPLCSSKRYFDEIDECRDFVLSIISKSEQLNNEKFKKEDLESSIELIKINPLSIPEYKRILGKEKETSPPFLPLAYPRNQA